MKRLFRALRAYLALVRTPLTKEERADLQVW